MLKNALESLAGSLAQSIESLSGNPCAAFGDCKEISSADLTAPDRAIQWAAGLGPQGEIRLHLCCSVESAERLGRVILEAAGLDQFDSATLKSTYFEVLSQAASAWSQALTRLLESKIEIEESGETSSFPAHLRFFVLQVRSGEEEFQAFAGVSAASFLKPTRPAPAEDSPGSSIPPPSAKSVSSFELLLDVELPVSISFGRALVPLKEILKLNSGSIVELDRAVTEPVDVIVNNCVIARGEVVVVEGNYGVRIQQIVSRQDRLKTMR